MANVIKQWNASDTADDNGEYVRIRGRAAGLFSFLLSLLGIDPTTTLVVDGRSVRSEVGSLAGFKRSVTPLSKIASADFGYAKPWKTAMVIGGICALILTPLPIIGWVMGGMIGLGYYFLNKELSLRILDFGGGSFEMRFKRSLIEGQNIDEHAGERVLSIVEMLLIGADHPRPPEVEQGVPATTGATLSRAADELGSVAERARQRASAIGAQAKNIGERTVTKVTSSLAAATGGASTKTNLPAVTCPGCGTAVIEADPFCSGCGAKLG